MILIDTDNKTLQYSEQKDSGKPGRSTYVLDPDTLSASEQEKVKEVYELIAGKAKLTPAID